MADELTVKDADGLESVVLSWLPTGPPKAVLHIMHGWCEHAQRYDRPARQLTAAGYGVYADDHRGHGQSGVRSNTLGDLGPRGMAGVVDAVHSVTEAVRKEHADVPVFALGHSWGSFIFQRYIRDWGGELGGAIFTGTTFFDPARPIPIGSLNDPFEPARTPYDWLSRDEAEVDKYVADPLCGFEMVQDTGAQPLDSVLFEGDDANIPKDLPIIIFNGAVDPVGGAEGGQALADHYRDVGIKDVSFKAYPDARHELFNETNRDEVVADVIAWLDAHS